MTGTYCWPIVTLPIKDQKPCVCLQSLQRQILLYLGICCRIWCHCNFAIAMNFVWCIAAIRIHGRRCDSDDVVFHCNGKSLHEPITSPQTTCRTECGKVDIMPIGSSLRPGHASITTHVDVHDCDRCIYSSHIAAELTILRQAAACMLSWMWQLN